MFQVAIRWSASSLSGDQARGGRGIAARFVSGYLHLADDDDDDCAAGGNTHAWVQVYVPGPGWVDLNSSGGGVGNEKLIRVAVAHHPREAIPLQGTCVLTARTGESLPAPTRPSKPRSRGFFFGTYVPTETTISGIAWRAHTTNGECQKTFCSKQILSLGNVM